MSEPEPVDGGRRFRRTLVRVMAVQIITLVMLWFIQQAFSA